MSEAGGVKDDESHRALDLLSLLRELGHHHLYSATECLMEVIRSWEELHHAGKMGLRHHVG